MTQVKSLSLKRSTKVTIVTMTEGAKEEGQMMEGLVMEEKRKLMIMMMEGVMGMRQRMKMEGRMRKERMLTPTLGGRRPWLRSWKRRPQRVNPQFS